MIKNNIMPQDVLLNTGFKYKEGHQKLNNIYLFNIDSN